MSTKATGETADVMSDIEKYLTTTELLDCQGRVQHTLTLMIDGRVKIRRASSTIIVEPSTGHIEPAGSIVPDHVLHAVGELAGQRVPVLHHDGVALARQRHRHPS